MNAAAAGFLPALSTRQQATGTKGPLTERWVGRSSAPILQQRDQREEFYPTISFS